MSKDNQAIVKVENVSKVFKLPHEKLSTVKQHFVNILNRKSYEKFKALDDVSFEIKKGEFFGIIGANGSGKSTLLKILAGIYQPTLGKVTIKGSLSPFIELGVGFNPELTARENIFLNAAILGMSRKQTEEKFNEIVKFSELEDFLDQKFKNFSSGMQVRLAFSIAIQANADLLLVDEVLAVGDSLFQQKCFETFLRLKKEGKTIIFVSHDLASIQDFSDRVLLIEEGKIAFVGDTNKTVLEYMKAGTRKANTGSVQKNDDKKVKIQKVIATDNEGNQREVFGLYEDFIIDCEIKNSIKRNINFGVSIHRTDGVYCAGVSTFLDNKPIEPGVKKISVRFYHPMLLPGSYYLVTGVFGQTDKQIIDFKDRALYFRIFGEAAGRGVSFIEHEWRFSK